MFKISYRTGRLSVIALFCFVSLAAVTPADVQYTSVTKFEMSGFLGRLMARSMPDELPQTIYLSGDKMLTVDETSESATLIDLGAETFTTINNKEETYSTMTFEELKEMFARQVESAREDAEDAEAERGDDVTTEFKFSFDRTGEMKTINGYSAERVLVTVQTDIATEEGAAGQTVLASEMWMSNEVPGYAEMRAFQERLGEKMGQTVFGGTSQDEMIAAIAQALPSADNAMLEASLREAREQAATLDGMTVRSTMHVVMVPPGQEYKESMVFADKAEEPKKKKKKKRGLGGLLKNLEEAAQSAAGSGGTEQNTLFSITTEIGDVSTASVPSSMFDIPAGYKLVSFGEM